MPLVLGPTFSMKIIAAGWNFLQSAAAAFLPAASPSGYSMASAHERRCLNRASSTTARPAASVDLMTAGMLRASLIRIGLAPRPISMARAIAAAPGGPSVSPAGRPGGEGAPAARQQDEGLVHPLIPNI